MYYNTRAICLIRSETVRFPKSFLSLSQIITVFVLSSLLSACSLHLRGAYLLPDEINNLSLTSFDQYDSLTRKVKRQLKYNGITIVEPSSNEPNLHLISQGLSERTISLYQNTRKAETALTYSTRFRVTVPKVGIFNFSTSVTRNYLDNPQTSLAKSIERDIVVDEMKEYASQQIIRRMAHLRIALDKGNTPEDIEKHLDAQMIEDLNQIETDTTRIKQKLESEIH